MAVTSDDHPPPGVEPLNTAPEQRTRIASLLALADRDTVIGLAEVCLDGVDDPILVQPPRVGTTMLTVVEPVEASRFHLTEVLVTETEVEHLGVRGWATRMGDDPDGCLAAAICEAEWVAGGIHADAVARLCDDADAERIAERDREWADLVPTIVDFEEMAE